MQSKVTEDARDRVMNTLPNRLEDHNDLKECSREGELKLDLVLHNTTGARDTYNKVYNIFEWLKNERLEKGFLYNSNLYTVELDYDSEIPGIEKTMLKFLLLLNRNLTSN
jgi:hypothetical protein